MSENLDVYLLVLIDNADHYTQVFELLGMIDGVTTVLHSHGTNAISIVANWKKSELDNKKKEVENIPNVKKVEISEAKRKGRIVEISIQEKPIKITDKVTRKKPWPITKKGVWVLIILAGVFAAFDFAVYKFYYDEARLLGYLGIEFTIGVGVLIFVIQMKVDKERYSRG
jgi:hypothetical protein